METTEGTTKERTPIVREDRGLASKTDKMHVQGDTQGEHVPHTEQLHETTHRQTSDKHRPKHTGRRRGKKNKSSTERGDEHWQSTLDLWGRDNKTAKDLAEVNVVGTDLWYRQPPTVDWLNLQGLVVSLNMRGWGNEEGREGVWSAMARTKTMIAILVDHRQHTNRQRRRMETEIAEGWVGSGVAKKCKWAHAAAANCRVGGITIAVHPIMARYTEPTTKANDPRGWGRWKGVLIKGKKKKTIIIGTYAPSKNTDEEAVESMWQRQEQCMSLMAAHEKESDPMMQYIHDLSKLVRQRQKEGYRVIVMGDINVNLHNDKPATKKWKLCTEQTGMINVMQAWWPHLRHKFVTWKNGSNQSWIDHVYTDTKTMTDACITGVGIDNSEWGSDSDHSMIGIRVNFTNMVGRTQGMEPLYKPRQRVVMAGQKQNKEQYMKIAEDREVVHKKKGRGIVTWAGKLQTINDGMRTASTKTRRKIQKKNDVVMRKIIKELLAIEEEQAQAQRKFGGAQQRHSWSDVFARRNSIHRLLVDIVKKVVKKSLRPKIYNSYSRVPD